MLNADAVTVFGGTGFLGQVIVRRLLETGHTVRVAARNPHAVAVKHGHGRVENWPVDVRDDVAVEQAVEGVNAVVNAVGLYTERGGQQFQAIHVDAAQRIARAAANADVASLVHVSGLGVDTISASAYVRARAEGEQVVRAVFPAAAILRPSVLFGPGDAFLGALAMMTRLPVIPLFGEGTMKLQPVHVADVAAAVEHAVQSRCVGVYELGGARVCSYREVVQAMLARDERRRVLLPVPFPVWLLLAAALSVLPNPPLTRDQIILMQQDNVVGDDARGFADMGIAPSGLDTVLPALRA